MIYLSRPPLFTACEDAAHATAIEAQGWTRCDEDAWRAAWQDRDTQAFARLKDEAARVALVAPAAIVAPLPAIVQGWEKN